jgi:hypothetical protein
MCAYAITYTTLFIFEQKYFDPGEVLYIYESIAGYGLVKIYLQTMIFVTENFTLAN